VSGAVGGDGAGGGRGIHVVMFDLDDTLFAHMESVRAGVLAHRQSQGGAVAAADEAAEWERWHALEELHYVRFLNGELDLWQQRRQRVRDFLEPYGLDLSDDEVANGWYTEFFERYREAWHLHADTLPCLDALTEAIPGVRFGIITNADLAGQHDKLRALDVLPRFDHVIASGDVGAPKPDPRIFAAAADAFGIEPHEVAYIGDRLETDALGAIAAGMTGVWIDRPGAATAEELQRAAEAGVHVIRGLDELAPLLAPR
jgi:putative hydrolase of the HAD superfamily